MRHSAALIDEAGRRSRASFRQRLDMLRDLALPVAQSALAAALAWTVAREVAGHGRPFFAPVAAVIAVGASLGQRSRRTVELVVGVALGVAVADLLLAAIGTGTWQLALVVVLAMVAAILLWGGVMLTTQAAVSAVLVATLARGDDVDFTRAIDALIGGVAALVVSALVPAQPLRRVRRAAAQAIPELAATIEDIAAALRADDIHRAEAALDRARDIDALAAGLRGEVQLGHEMIRLSPTRRATRSAVRRYDDAARQLDLAVRNVRVLARGATRALDMGDRVPPSLPAALDDLAAAVRGLGVVLERGEGSEEARAAAIRAAGRATLVLEETGNMSVSVLVGQIRSTAVDLLRGLGLDKEQSQRAVREAADTLRAGS
jgi:uncharacterized membrane protein YgaE (UPF0421/DUF939 family)